MKKIIVTGSSSGFGFLTVQTLAQKGHTVYATMRNTGTKNANAVLSLKNWARENNADIRIIELDITSDESVHNAVTQIAEDAGQIDVLVNNAGLMTWGLSETLSTKQLSEVFEANVFGSDRMNKAVLPYMHDQNQGLIIQLSSSLSRLHLPYLGAYSAAKAAIDILAETLHYELCKTGIDAVIVQPGAYPSTDLLKKLVASDNPSAADKYGEFGSKLAQTINHVFTQTPESPDPQEVATLVADIIEMPAGQRKLWTTIGAGPASSSLEKINESTYQLSQQVQGAMGFHS
jgi:NAD(P)-dependent dehydrogenase (short-subunit alcohol dehydrogenase family)